MSKFFNIFSITKFSKITNFYNLYNLVKYKSQIKKFIAISLNIPINCKQLKELIKTSKIKYQSAFEIEKDISNLVIEAELLIGQEKHGEAKILLQRALKIANDYQAYGNISAVYELLSALAYKEGGITEAEDMLADFIDKLLQLGYPEDHNSIIRFKLKLARLYQVIGNIDLAELGYQDCIRAQENKINKLNESDSNTEILYINSLFWYGKLLTEKKELPKAKIYFKKCLTRVETSNVTNIINPAQKMVVYYHNADIAAALREYDLALKYLYSAIDIGTIHDIGNPELPLYVVKVGIIFIQKGMYDNAEYWCKNALILSADSVEVKKEAQSCLDKIDSLRLQKK